MQCPQSQHENRDGAKFCDECGAQLSPECHACGTENRPGAKFCNECGASLTASTSALSLAQSTQRQPDAESRFHAMLSAVTGLLQGQRRVTYRTLKHILGFGDALLEEIREELTLRRLAIDEEGKVLVWADEAQPAVQTTTTPIHAPAPPETATVTFPVSPELAPSTKETDKEIEPAAPEESSVTITPEPIRTAPKAERRQLTVMFCDLADSTKLSRQLDPEDLREVVRAYQATAAEVLQQYEGHMAQYLGDGLLIYFGWPIAHEDDAQRSLHAGLGIVEAIATTLNPRLQQEKGVQLTVRLGVHTGPVVVGEMGGGERHENLATGETVNIAARLEGLAAPNTVMISQLTARLVVGAFALEDLGPHELKGVAEPMQVFRVLSPMEIHEDENTVADAPFLMGRDEEVGLLLRRWEQAKESLGQVVLISGTAGIGKSALTGVLRAHVRDDGMPRIAFRCSPYHQNSALYPVIAHVERLLDLQREDAPETKLDKLEQRLRPYSLTLEEVVPLFAALLSVPLDDRYAALTLTPHQQKQQTLDALVGWMLEEAEKQPVLVAWEDLHWADPSTLEFLGLVLEQTPTVPMLHLLTYRPEFDVPWPVRSHMTPITLNRLERPQVEALITHLARGKELPTEVVEHIVAKTDGVPLYVEELTKMLLESELLRGEEDAYVLTGPLSTVAIPDTLQDSLMARLDQLNAAKEIAQLGAVLGREFAYEILRAIAFQKDEMLQAGLAQLVEAELLYQRGRPPRARYIFKHALIQDAAYQSLLKSHRQQLHQSTAQVLVDHFPETEETRPELLAHHYTEAGLTDQAVGYWEKAGQQAMQRSANAEAIAHLQQGLELVKTLPDTSERARQELTLQRMLGVPLLATKGWAAPEVEAVYSRARALCQQIGDTLHIFPVLTGLWVFYEVRGDLQIARELAEQLLTLAQRQRDSTLILQGHRPLGETWFWLGELVSARAHLDQGLVLYDPEEHHSHAFLYGQDPGIGLWGYSALVLWMLGYVDQARQSNHEVLALAHALDHPLSLVQGLTFAARFHQLCRQWDAVQEYTEAVISLSTDQGFALYVAWAAMLQGRALTAQGQEEEGVTRMRHGLAAWQKTGAQLNQVYNLTLLAEAYGNMGHITDGLNTLSDALTLMERTEERHSEAEIYRLKGTLLLRQAAPDAAQAETCFHQALDIARQQHAKSRELCTATSLARLWQSQGKRQDARDLLAPVYGWFTEGFDTADLQDAKALLDELD